MDIVFTREDETAGSYIERTAGQLSDRLIQATVTASDLAEQWTAFSQGALRTSTYELCRTIKKTEKTTAREGKDMYLVDSQRNSPWNEEQLERLPQGLDDLMRKSK